MYFSPSFRKPSTTSWNLPGPRLQSCGEGGLIPRAGSSLLYPQRQEEPPLLPEMKKPRPSVNIGPWASVECEESGFFGFFSLAWKKQSAQKRGQPLPGQPFPGGKLASLSPPRAPPIGDWHGRAKFPCPHQGKNPGVFCWGGVGGGGGGWWYLNEKTGLLRSTAARPGSRACAASQALSALPPLRQPHPAPEPAPLTPEGRPAAPSPLELPSGLAGL